MRPHRWQPTRLPRPWDSLGKNTGVGCHFLLQCRKVKSESEVAQSCPTLRNPMDCSPPGSSVHGIFQARVLEWGAIAFYSAIKRNAFESVELKPRAYYTEWNKSEKENQISYITAYICNLEKWYWWTYLQGRNRYADIENRCSRGRRGWQKLKWQWNIYITNIHFYHNIMDTLEKKRFFFITFQ